jgi:GST-like protein
MNVQLAPSGWLNGADYSLADIATYPWVDRYALHDLDWSRVPHVKRWFDRVGERPAVKRGMSVPAVS